MKDNDTKEINDVVQLYFKGTYQGNAEQVRSAFHPDTHITGILNDEYIDWSLADFIAMVTKQPTARMQGEKYDKEILSIDKTKSTASVKARVSVGKFIFIDYITLLKINGRWLIRSKSFTPE